MQKWAWESPAMWTLPRRGSVSAYEISDWRECLLFILHRCNSVWYVVCPTDCMNYLLNYTRGLDCRHGVPSLSFIFILHFRSTLRNTVKQVFINKLVVTRLSNPCFSVAQRFIAACSHPHSWLRHFATSRKVAGSITGGVYGIFRWLNPSGRPDYGLGSNSASNRNTRDISWGWRRPVRGADTSPLRVPVI